MGLINDVWWLVGFLMAAPVAVPGVENVLAGNNAIGALFFVLAILVLLLPEYLRWRLLGGSSPFERLPLLGSRGDGSEE